MAEGEENLFDDQAAANYLVETIFNEELHSVLREVFGHPEFHPGQREAITYYVRGRDVFFIAGTGQGKTLCFQLPLFLPEVPKDQFILVFVPLHGLEMNHEEEARKLRLGPGSVVSLRSDDYYARNGVAKPDLASGRYRLVFAAPELIKGAIVDFVRDKNIASKIFGIVVDEAHTAVDWTFREAMKQFVQLRRALVVENIRIPMLAMTATAAPEKIRAIIEVLGLDPARMDVVYGDIYRPNLHWSCETDTGARTLRGIREWLSHPANRPAIVFSASYAREVHMESVLDGIEYGRFHGTYSEAKKRQVLCDFLDSRINIVSATTAFGLGINKPDVRTVILYGLFTDLAQIMQLAGRGGRDGLICRIIVIVPRLTEKSKAKIPFTTLEFLQSVSVCRVRLLLARFGNVANFDREFRCGTCDICVATGAVVLADRAPTVAGLMDAVQEAAAAVGLLAVGDRTFVVAGDHTGRFAAVAKPPTDVMVWVFLLPPGPIAAVHVYKSSLRRLSDAEERRVVVPAGLVLVSANVKKALYGALDNARQQLAALYSYSYQDICSDASIDEISVVLPMSPVQMARISFIQRKFAEFLDNAIKDVLYEYRNEINRLRP